MPIILSDDDASRVARVVTAFERGFGRQAGAAPTTLQAASQSILAVLCEDLQSDGEALALVCRLEQANSVQSVTLVGGNVEAIQLGLRLKDADPYAYTEPIPVEADGSARAVREAINALRLLPSGDFAVSLGTFTYQDVRYPTGRWFVEVGGRFAGSQFPLLGGKIKYNGGDWIDNSYVSPLVIARTRTLPQWEPITVYAGLPVPTPTPLKAGAKVIATQVAGVGWVVTAAEARDYFRG